MYRVHQYTLFSLQLPYLKYSNSLVGVKQISVYCLLYWPLSLDFNLEKALPLQKIKI